MAACGNNANNSDVKTDSSQKVSDRALYQDVVLFSRDKINNYEYSTFVAYLEEKGFEYSTKADPITEGYYTVTIEDGSKYNVEASFWPDVDLWGGYEEWLECDKESQEYIDTTVLTDIIYGSELYGIEFGVDAQVDSELFSDFVMYYRTYDGVENKGTLLDSFEELESFVNTKMEENK